MKSPRLLEENIMKIYDKFYVGFQKNRYNSTDDQRLLGFATYVEDNAKFQKRKETVDKWSDNDIKPIYIENKPLHGFKIVDTVSRWSTNNKLFRVLDPRGFEFEITAENLFDIIQNAGVVKGMITEAMLLARPAHHSGKNYLLSENSDEYKNYLKGPAAKAKMVPGNLMSHPGHKDIIYRYEGKFAYNILNNDVKRTDPYYNRRYGYWSQQADKNDFSKVSTEVVYTVDRKQDKPVMVYTEFRIYDDGEITPSIHIRKSPFKDLLECNDAPEGIDEFTVPIGEVLDWDRVTSQLGGYRTKYVLFENKQDSFDKKYTEEQLEEMFKPFDRYAGGGYAEDKEFYGKITSRIEELI